MPKMTKTSIVVLFIVFTALQMADLFTTEVALRDGWAVESNPIVMNPIIRYGGKISLVFFVGLLLTRLEDKEKFIALYTAVAVSSVPIILLIQFL